ncbi:MAG: hypothetical protein IJ299_02350 [Oscillospiraceae bacterium]|nr:hypothetical protein [Oscillospiraceae bacterium]
MENNYAGKITTDMLFDEVAENVGLGDHSNPARVFKKHLGKSPTEYIGDTYKREKTAHAIPVNERYSWIKEL